MQLRFKYNLRVNIFIFAIIVLLSSPIANGRQGKFNWNQFRGPNGQGVADSDRIPVQFGPESNVLWKTAIPPGHSSVVVWNNRIFLTANEPGNKKELITLAIDRQDGGVLTCLEAATGKEFFRERIGAAGQYTASPIAAGDKIITTSVKGIVTVIQVDNELKVLARNNFGDKIFATPAVAENKIYLRTTGHLYALGE